MNPDQLVPQPKEHHRSRWIVVLLALLSTLGAGVLGMVVASELWSRGFVRQAMAIPVFKDVVGDLGGMPVKIPRHIPEFLEYDSTPGWRLPVRTHASRISSFKFEIRYPDMQTLATQELVSDYVQRRLYEHSWIHMSVQSAEINPEHGFLDRLYADEIAIPGSHQPQNLYSQLPSSLNGLHLYAKQGVNPQTGRSHRYEWAEGDILVAFDEQGKVKTRIRCSFKRGAETYSGCQQRWSMDSFGLSVDMLAYYAPVLLPHWQDIQTRTSQFVLGFKDPTATPDERSPR